MSKMPRQWYIKQAREQWQSDGSIEIDDNATVSMGAENGAYVAAWVWVYDPLSDDDAQEVTHG